MLLSAYCVPVIEKLKVLVFPDKSISSSLPPPLPPKWIAKMSALGPVQFTLKPLRPSCLPTFAENEVLKAVFTKFLTVPSPWLSGRVQHIASDSVTPGSTIAVQLTTSPCRSTKELLTVAAWAVPPATSSAAVIMSRRTAFFISDTPPFTPHQVTLVQSSLPRYGQ